MICRVRGSLDGIVDEIIVSVRDERQRDSVFPYIKDTQTFIYDELSNIGPLAGIHSCLKSARGEYVFIVACDMPYVNKQAIEMLFMMAEGHDAAVPARENGLIEPLHAVYRRKPMLEAVEASIEKGERRISSPLSYLKDVVYVPVERIASVDPGLKTFLNINSARDMPPE